MRNIPYYGLTLALALLSACAKSGANSEATASAREAQAEAHDMTLVQDSARLYWEAVRWGDGSKAASFLEDPDQRLLYEAWLEDQKETTRYLEIQVLQVKLHAEEVDPPPNRLRIATAHIRVKSYALPAQVLESKTLQQLWYKSPNGWWIDWEPSAD